MTDQPRATHADYEHGYADGIEWATVYGAATPAVGLEAMAEIVHNARWPADRQMDITPFADEDRNGREYCFRIARAVLAAKPASHAAVGGEDLRQTLTNWFNSLPIDFLRDPKKCNAEFAMLMRCIPAAQPASPLRGRDWQQMGTAPKDAEIIGQDPDGRIFTLRWEPDDCGENWYDVHGDQLAYPVRWMPMPSPEQPAADQVTGPEDTWTQQHIEANAATPAVGGDMHRSELNDAGNACLELCAKHGFATGHGDTVADMIREIDGQIATPDNADALANCQANCRGLRQRAEAAEAKLAATPAVGGLSPSDADWKRAVECAFLCLHNVSVTRAELDNAMQHAFGILALAQPASPLRGREPQSSAEYHQQRGAAWDIIDEAILSYRNFMMDDDYEPYQALEKIIGKLIERRNLYHTEQLDVPKRPSSASPPEQPAADPGTGMLINTLKRIEYALRKDSLTDHERIADARAVVCAAISKAAPEPELPAARPMGQS